MAFAVVRLSDFINQRTGITMATKGYKDRTDLEKIKKQWVKLTGLHSREEWSAAVIRAATAAEIAANLAIRDEFKASSQFDADFVDSLLRGANCLKGKLERLLRPLVKGTEKEKTVATLSKVALKINDIRNEIAHTGKFSGEKEATQVIADCRTFVEGLVQLYVDNYTLPEPKASK